MSFAPARGHGYRGGRWKQPASRRPSIAQNPATSTTKPPSLGKLLGTIKLTDLDETTRNYADAALIRNVEIVTSFNWVQASKPTIVVPGSPARWTPPRGLTLLQEDKGDFLRDRNAAQFPQHPMEPSIVAGLLSNPDLANEINIVACGSTFGNLLRFVRGQNKSFRILMELIGETLFLVRRENSPTELIQDVRGYGHTFPEAYTTWDADVKQSSSHQRLLRYKFGGLDLLVRFEGDGYLPQLSDSPLKPSSATEIRSNESADISKLTDTLQETRVQTGETPQSGNSDIIVKHLGQLVNQDQIFDLKTRSIKKKDQDIIGEEIPRLWLAQIRNFIIAYHERGTFKEANIEIKNIESDVFKWEKEQNAVLSKLAALLHLLIAKAHEQKDGFYEIRRLEGGELELRARLPDSGTTLSPETRDRWTRGSAPTSNGEEPNTAPSVETNILSWDDGQDNDYTACTDGCGYCGHCSY